jgi:hypothetical protein
MKGSKEFFEELREGEEYVSVMMSMDVYNGISLENRLRMTDPKVRQKNSKFTNDETHKELVKKVAKANKELRDYEFNINHK